MLAIGWLSAVLLAAVLAPSTPPAPDLLAISQPPFAAPTHWLGTDAQGLDVAEGILQGARTLLLVSVPATLLTLALGTFLGSAAGFWGNKGARVARGWLAAWVVLTLSALVLAPQLLRFPWALGTGLVLGAALLGQLGARARWGWRPAALPLDTALTGLITLLDSVPLLVLVLAVAAVQEPSAPGLVALMALTCWTTPARLMRAATLQAREQVFVEAARALGLSNWHVLSRHIWPTTWRVLLVRAPLTLALLISLETTLSFLGVGLPQETPSWGRLLAGVRLDPAAWWLLVWPGAVLALTLLSLQRLSSRK